MITQPHAAVSIEHRGNVIYLGFPTDAPPPAPDGDDSWWPWSAGAEAEAAAPGKTSTATRPLPARWSPRPCRVIADRLARSQLAADLRDYAWLIGFLTAAVLLWTVGEHVHDLIHTLTGGTR